ncbi:hypothetical protein [Synechococcus sp. BA-132 BA5]|uniref:hypothetical protein n=1 Tax=Synechococcus sp. BA-132 BA5 TaxID=3110252 RepID=UPI002B206D6A|nr:hypothetical protein [Synechococcus sp. BA-132 BA5]MEA5416207.1 hypothetical protein [Synechococcus sp. BA-132 BA5]
MTPPTSPPASLGRFRRSSTSPRRRPLSPPKPPPVSSPDQPCSHSKPAPATVPEGCWLADGSPIDFQAAARIQQEAAGLMRCLGETVYAYDQGFWRPVTTNALKRQAQQMLRRFWSPRHSQGCIFGSHAQVMATVESLKICLSQDSLLSVDHRPHVIVFSNGTYDLQQQRLVDHDPDHGATYRLALPFLDAAACPPELERVMERCYPPGAEAIIQAMIRWVVDPSIPYGQCFHLQGSSGSGKGLLIDFLRSLFPPELHGDMLCPSLLSGPEKIHQFILGRRLVVFPDCPTSFKAQKRWNTFYELVENKLVTTRKLHCGEAEQSRRMDCRYILASTGPFTSSDGTDGFQRRVRTLCTVPRRGDQDYRLESDLQAPSERYLSIRAEAVSWALRMPVGEVLAVLDGKDPAGLLEDSARDAAVSGDSVSLWADACLIPAAGPDGPDTIVADQDWMEMFEVFKAWCQFTCSPVVPLSNFQGQLRKLLGPTRCLPRSKAPMASTSTGEASLRRNLPKLDAGFQLRPDVLVDQTRLDPRALGNGGLAALAQLPAATRRSDGVDG